MLPNITPALRRTLHIGSMMIPCIQVSRHAARHHDPFLLLKECEETPNQFALILEVEDVDEVRGVNDVELAF
jgi:hypothetical protein